MMNHHTTIHQHLHHKWLRKDKSMKIIMKDEIVNEASWCRITPDYVHICDGKNNIAYRIDNNFNSFEFESSAGLDGFYKVPLHYSKMLCPQDVINDLNSKELKNYNTAHCPEINAKRIKLIPFNIGRDLYMRYSVDFAVEAPKLTIEDRQGSWTKVYGPNDLYTIAEKSYSYDVSFTHPKDKEERDLVTMRIDNATNLNCDDVNPYELGVVVDPYCDFRYYEIVIYE